MTNPSCRTKFFIPPFDEVFHVTTFGKRLKAIRNKQGFEAAKEEAENIYERIADSLREIFKDGDTTIVYREICVKKIDDFISELKKYKKSFYKDEFKGVGIYWANSIDFGMAYWCSDDAEVRLMMEARISHEDVDFLNTIADGIQFGYDIENEIRLYDGKTIKLIRVFPRDDSDVYDSSEPIGLDIDVIV